MGAKRYIVQLATFGLLAAVVAAAFNYFVDPYGVNNARRISGFNQYKVDINAHARLLKKYQPGFDEYNTLIVGKSRVEMGLDPSHACFDKADMHVYNLGVPGAELSTQLAYAMNVIYEQPIEKLLLSVDFTDYISTRQSRLAERPQYMQEGQRSLKYFPWGEVNSGYWKVVAQDYFRSLFSLDALASSVKTVAMQGSASTDRDIRGFNPGLDFAGMVRVEGSRALFEQKLNDLRKKYGRPWYFRDERGRVAASMGDLSAFLEFLTTRGIKVYVFANPLHAEFWKLMEANGHMVLYEDWLQTISTLLRSYPAEEVEFWDFSGQSPYIQEQVPPYGVRGGPLNWFWEPSHYRRELGDLMIETMLSEACGTQAVFGRRVR